MVWSGEPAGEGLGESAAGEGVGSGESGWGESDTGEGDPTGDGELDAGDGELDAGDGEPDAGKGLGVRVERGGRTNVEHVTFHTHITSPAGNSASIAPNSSRHFGMLVLLLGLSGLVGFWTMGFGHSI